MGRRIKSGDDNLWVARPQKKYFAAVMTPGTQVIIELLGGVAMLLWGVRMVRTGIMRAWGDRLKRFIELHISNRFSAFGAGAAATSILGSPTAMALIIAGLAASGLISTPIGLAVMLGADVGSAVIATIFASGTSSIVWMSPILLFAGYVIFTMSREFRPHNAGRILIGFALVLLSLKLIIQATTPLREATLFHEVLTAIGHEPMLGFLAGALLAWMCHSTLTAVLIVASFLLSGSLDLPASLSIIMGINCGGGLPAVTATAGQPPAARRLPVANLLCRTAVSLAGLAAIGWLTPYVTALPVGPVEAAVLFHGAFNIVTRLALLPFTGPIARLATQLVPDQEQFADNLKAPRYLDPVALSNPSVALSNATLETVRMSELLDRLFATALDVLRSGSLEKLKELKALDDLLNKYQASVQAYLSDLSQMELDKSEGRRALELMLYSSNLEHAGDVIHLNLADRIKAKAKQSIKFTVAQHASLDDLCYIIHQSLRLATSVLTSRDIDAARRLIAQKDAFRTLENKVIDEHFRDGAKAKGATSRKSALYVDLIRDLHRINSHIVSAGYPIVEAAGLLRDSRLRSDIPQPEET